MNNVIDIDVSRMFDYPKCAIRCRTLEDAKALCDSVRTQNSRMAGRFSKSYTAWDYGDRTCYTLFYDTSSSPEGLSRYNVEWFIESGYEVVEFSDLLNNNLDIEESDQPIDILLRFE